MFDIEEIMKNVPHRFPFLLLDRVTEFEANKSVTTIKNVSMNEFQFLGHFPGKPIFPGVLIIEHMAQSAAFLMVKSGSENGVPEGTLYFLGKVGKMIFKKPVVPGDQIITEITIEKMIAGSAMVKAVSRVDGQMVAKGELMFATSKQ